MLAMLMATQAGMNVVTAPAHIWIVSEHLATILKATDVTGGLRLALFV